MSSLPQDHNLSREERQQKEATTFPDRQGEFIVLKTEFDGIIGWKYDSATRRFNACFKKADPYGAGVKEQVRRRTSVSQVGSTFSSYRAAVQAAIAERDSNNWFNDDGDDLWKYGPPYDSRENRNVETDTAFLIEVLSTAEYKKREQKERRKGEIAEERATKRIRQDAVIQVRGLIVWAANFTVDGGVCRASCKGGIHYLSTDVQKVNTEALKIMEKQYGISLEDNLEKICREQGFGEDTKESIRSDWYDESTGGLAVQGWYGNSNELVRLNVVPLTTKMVERCSKTVLSAYLTEHCVAFVGNATLLDKSSLVTFAKAHFERGPNAEGAKAEQATAEEQSMKK
jgi:hypothetical protein